jgi:pyridoxamine 5'-phosphate oxidase
VAYSFWLEIAHYPECAVSPNLPQFTCSFESEVTVNKNHSANDPIKRFGKWYEEAQTGKGGLLSKNWLISLGTRVVRRVLTAVLPFSNLLRPDIATLSTITPENKPSARSILFKGFVLGGFSFYTDYESNKGKELGANPYAVMVFYWHFPPRQVRIDGRVIMLSRKAAEADWKARRRENQAASAALPQSSLIEEREYLINKVDQIKRRYKGKSIPCPDSWGGYCLIPDKIEFWEGRLDWIHLRELYVMSNGTWKRMLLAP